MRTATWMFLIVIASASCDSCRPPDQGQREAEVGKAKLTEPEPGPATPHETTSPVVAEATVVERSGDVRVERAPGSERMVGQAGSPDALFVGDSVLTGGDGSATVDITQNTRVVLGPSSHLQVGVHRRNELVLHAGTASVSGDELKGVTRRFMFLTPGGLVFYAGPAMELTVAADGQVRVDAKDCPERPEKKIPSGEVRPPRPRCGFIVTGEEQPLVTGDRVVIGPGLDVVRQEVGEEDPDAASWLAGRAEALAADPAPAVEAFAGWLGQALEDMGTFMDDIEARRERNKVLIKKLRDLRKQGKPDASKAVSENALEGGPGSEIAAVKTELTENSSQQYDLRHQLLTRWYQLRLHIDLLGPHLTDENLGRSMAEVHGDVEATGMRLKELFSRRSTIRKMPKYMPKPMAPHPSVGAPPKKPVEKAP